LKTGIFLSIFFIVLVSFSFFVFAQQTFSISKKPLRDVLVAEFPSIPLQYDVTLKNKLVVSDHYKMFSLLDVLLSPVSLIKFDPMEEKNIILSVYIKDRTPGKFAYTYYIKNSYEIYEDRFVFSIVRASDAFSIDVPETIERFDKEIKIKIKNNLNVEFENLSLSSTSPLIASSEKFSLKPLEEKELTLVLSDAIKKEKAGVKKIEFVLAYEGDGAEGENYKFEREIVLEEHKDVVTEKKEGLIFIGKKIEIKKTNVGNTPLTEIIKIELSTFERIFASANAEGKISKQAGKYVYEFNVYLEPNQSATIKVKINYAWLIIPLIIVLIFVIVILVLSKEKNVVFEKTVKKLKTKTGTFALRVYLTVKNKTTQELKDVAILDSVPLSLKYHEYGLTVPDKVEGDKLYWNLENLLPGEEKTVSYICLSKIKYEGVMKLPPAKLKFINQKNQKVIVTSNVPKIFVSSEEE